MQSMNGATVLRPRLIDALAREAASYPLDRKVLVCPRRGVGREILRWLARECGGWIGFEVTTPLALAKELVTARLVEQGLSVADEFDELALIDESIDAAVVEPGGAVLEPFVQSAGLRSAMANTIQALRLAGIDEATLGRAGFRDRHKREALARVMAQYERVLLRERRVDAAGVLRLARDELRVGATPLPEARYYVLPGQERRGRSGALLGLLVERGAVVIDDDPVIGLAVPGALLAVGPEPPSSLAHSSPHSGARVSPLAWLHAVEQAPAPAGVAVELDLFAAGSVSDEVREALRRIVARGLAWDEVEIVAVDPMLYGATIDSFARRLGIPVTYAAGLPVARTRPGRAVDTYLRWVRDDFAAHILRESIERGDVSPPAGGHGTPGPGLARRLRRLMIGRGRARFAEALARARRGVDVEREADELTAAEAVEAKERERRTLDDLAAIIEPVLAATPELPGRVDAATATVSPADLARGLLAFLRLVPVEAGPRARAANVEQTARDRLIVRLERLAAVALRPTTLDAAIAIIAAKLDTRVPARGADGAAPWSSCGGHLHVSDAEHGGHTGRRATFVIGLDAVRFPGVSPHDTLLGDEERRRLVEESGYAPIPTSADVLQERRWHLARLLSRLRGEVTLSYSAWEAAEARTVAPGAEMLQAFRLRTRQPAADYEAMHAALQDRASAVPRAAGRLDRADVWLAALSRDGVMLRGTEVVRRAFPGLDAGLCAAEARRGASFSAHHGRITPRPGLDPRNHPNLAVSAKRLETLGTCPLRYLLRYVLGVMPPDDADWAADRWLGPLERGLLLHRVYERALRRARERGHSPADDAFGSIALEALEHEVARLAERVPPPGDAVCAIEVELLREDVLAFTQMTRARGAPWTELEYRFGASDRSRSGPVQLDLAGGALRVTGAIDRIDREPDGRLVVIDYKTGSVASFGRPRPVFNGGRRLQHALYAAVVQRFPARIARAEYHFPTQRGEAQVARFETRELAPGGQVVDALLDLVRDGFFHPTNDPDDCRVCDYRESCRVRDDGGRTDSPMAAWAQRADAPELELLRRLRGREG
jgi:ATP-dependent helicase/nuclease subunit B